MAVAGRIRAEGEPLQAPFSHKPCVICEYDIGQPPLSETSPDDDNSGSDFAGFLMTPCQVETSWGNVRLLGFPLIDDAVAENCLSATEIANARNFLRSTSFEDRAGLSVVSVLSVFSEVWSDDDGRVTKHMRLTGTPIDDILPSSSEENAQAYRDVVGQDEDLDQLDDFTLDEGARLFNTVPKLIEKRVEPGEQVVVFGIYNQSRGGLLPPQGSTVVNRLMRGTAEEIATKRRRGMLRYGIGSAVVLVILHGAIAGAVINLAKEKVVPPPVENNVRLLLPRERPFV